jgi:peptidoglycan hydrolase-like protein with peptidoglycan-binding domain
MVKATIASEDAQLTAMLLFVVAKKLGGFLATNDWSVSRPATTELTSAKKPRFAAAY